MTARLNTVEAAQRLRLNPQNLNRWCRKGIGPAYIRVGKKVMYPDEKIQVWLQDHRETLVQPIALADLALQLPPVFSFIGDPVAIQQAIRDEWDR